MGKRIYEVEFHPKAILDIRESIKWYRQRDEQAAKDLRKLIEAAESLIRRSPESCAPYYQGTLGYRFQKFPFVLAYILLGNRVYVIALAHTRRRPGYWRDRVD